MTHRMRYALDLVLTHVGTGQDSRVITDGPSEWRWEVMVEGDFYTAYSGEMMECVTLEREYDAQPHVIESPQGDPVCVN